MTIHRASLSGRPACGAETGKVSSTGIPQFITCPDCKRHEMAPEEALEAIRKAAQAFREARP